jgi:hypothetical protein
VFDFLKKTFGSQNSGDDIIAMLMEHSQKFVLIGRQIADDCVEEGLRKGEIVKLSEMEKFIASNHLYNTQAVVNGFLTRIQDYIAAEEIINLSVEGGDAIFVHKNHVAAFLQKIRSGESAQESESHHDEVQDTAGDEILRGQEALAHEVALFLSDIKNASESLAKLLEGILPARKAIELLAQRKGERVVPTSGWTVNATLGYSGGTRQGFIRVEDPKLVSFLQLDNPKVYVMIGAKTKKLFGEGDNYGGYFAFSYYVHSGSIVNEDRQNSIRKDLQFIDDILRQYNFPTSLPDLLQRAGYQNLARKWAAIAQQGAPADVSASRPRR